MVIPLFFITFATEMFRLPKLITKTLSVRLSLQVVTAMSILLLVSLIVMLHFSRKAVKEEALQKTTQTLEGTALQLDNELLSIEQTSGNFYFNLLQYINQPGMIHLYCRKVVESDPIINGCAIAFEPGYFN